MGCGSTCSRILLIFFTAVLSLIGLAILAVGLLGKFGAKTILEPLFEHAFQGITHIRENLNSGSSESTTTATLDHDLSALLEPISLTFISFGAVIATLSIIGFIGSCCKSKCLLSLYAFFVSLSGLALVILSAIILSGSANERLQNEFLKSIEDNYYGLHHTDTGSLAWNFIMIQFQCCGVFGYTDFNRSKHWDRETTINNHTVTLVTPVACCKMNGTFPNVTPSNDQCAVAPNDDTSNWNKGCWKEMDSYVSYYKPFIALVIAGILIVEVIVIVWSCVVAKQLNQVHSY